MNNEIAEFIETKNTIKIIDWFKSGGEPNSFVLHKDSNKTLIQCFMDSHDDEDENLVVLKLLLQHKCDPNLSVEKSELPVFSALWFDSINILQLLITNGVNLNVRNEENDTPLIKAVLLEDIEFVSLILSNLNKEEINAIGSIYYNSALGLTIMNYNAEMLKLLLDHRASPSIKEVQNELQSIFDPNIKNEVMSLINASSFQ